MSNLEYIQTSDGFYNYLNQLKLSGITIKQKTKYIYTIKDGYYNFNINLKKLNCFLCKNYKTCSLKKCKHIYLILFKFFKLSNAELMFLWINDNFKNIIEQKEMVIKIQDLECLICIDNVFKKYTKIKQIIHCLNCGKFFHQKCYQKTFSNKCVNCQLLL